ncbi:MATE family efflux transporter [Nonlabens sp. Ci31]|jgi:putative MATE family efflux protein|uniref:MATE family efflux transporter n=1 Tax=Nonlabens sp. Ci31 TaxID=2608253 RepID=UPI00146292EE|nr:MATE family efflux transporter [Nonlabens sp. Ci31]QJP33877.1 MATE family efflux transporter [Nonlabens sp. Ci31]
MAVQINTSQILKLAIPAIIAGIAEPLISITDLAIIGKMEGDTTNALAAIGLVGTFLSAIIWTLAQTKTSISSIVSNTLGANQLEKINDLIPQVVWLNIVLGILIYLITAPIASFIFAAYKAQGDVLSIASSYYQVRSLGFPMTLCAFAIFGIFRGLQNTSWAMIASLSGAVVNILLTLTLVYGIDGVIPSYGIMGAAYGSLAAQLVMLLIAIYFLYKNTMFSLKLTIWQPHEKLRKHIGLTANFFLRTVAINVAIYFSYRFANDYGVAEAAAHAVLMNIWLLFSFLVDGFANAGNAIGGKLLGSKDGESLKYLANKTSLYGVVIAVFLTIICALLYPVLGNRFTDDPEVLEIIANTFWIVLLMQPINAVAFVYDGIFKGWGEASYLRNLLWLLTALVFLPVLFLLDYFGWDLYAVWFAFFAWMIGRAAVLFFKFKSKVAAMES